MVAVLDPFQVAVRRADAIALVGIAPVDVVVVFGRVFIDDGVAFVVVALADQPAEDVTRVCAPGIGDAGVSVPAVQGSHVVAGDRSPVDVTRGSGGRSGERRGGEE